jgi:ketosteroid isomerase-like protein
MRRGFGDWNERNLDVVASRWHEDIVWEEPEAFPDGAVRRGREAVVERMAERLRLLGQVQIEAVEVSEIGPRVLAEVVVHGRGSHSGVPASVREWLVFDFSDDDRVIRLREFLDRDAALAAAREPS